MSRAAWNRFLLVVVAILVLLAWFLRRDVSQPNYVFMPEMVFSIPYDSYSANSSFPDGKTFQPPVAGTVARGTTYSDFLASEADAMRAGEELNNPWNELGVDADELMAAKDRGRMLYSRYCLPCHGGVGNGDGPVAMHGFPAPPPFTSETALEMTDGRMFHVVTFGQKFLADKHMPGYATQIENDDRWKVILHVRTLQEAAVRQARAEQEARESILAGKAIFERLNCNKCHTVSADEKPVGPFLGKIAATYSRDQLHEAVLHPSKTIAEGFLAQVFFMLDGTMHSGFVTGETDEQVTIRNSDGNEIILLTEDIDARRTLEKSPMPDGLINDLSSEELGSLLDYMQSLAVEPGEDSTEDGEQTSGEESAGENQ